MKKLFNIPCVIAIVCILVGLCWPVSTNTNIDNDTLLVNIAKPTTSILELVNPISNTVTDDTDRVKLAIFNQEFATRVKTYEVDAQQVNDVYVLAGSLFFENSLRGKYKNLDTMMIELIQKSTSDDNHKLTTAEKEELSSSFMGLSWSLLQQK